MPSLTSYVLVGVGYFQRAIDWFDQLAPSSRLEDLRRLVSDIRQNSRPLATAVQHVRSFLHLPTHDPIPTIEVLQHLLRPVLLLRTRLAETGVLLNIVSTIDRSQCPIDKDKQLIDDLVAARRGPTWWVWEWRRQELAAAAKNVVKQPPLPQGSKYTQVQTVFVALKEETSPLCGGTDLSHRRSAALEHSECVDYEPSAKPDAAAGGEESLKSAWSASRLKVMSGFATVSLAYLESENINVACTILNGLKAVHCHFGTSSSRLTFETVADTPLIKPFCASFTSLDEPVIRGNTLVKAHQTWAARHSEPQLAGHFASSAARLTQSLSRLTECIALRFAIVHSLWTVTKQGGEVSLVGRRFSRSVKYGDLFDAVKLAYPLSDLYTSLTRYLDAHLPLHRPALTFPTLTTRLNLNDMEAISTSELLVRIRVNTIYRPSHDHVAFTAVSSAALTEALASGTLSGADYVQYLIAGGRSKTEILRNLKEMRDVGLEGRDLTEVGEQLRDEPLLLAEYLRQLSVETA